MNTDKHDSLFSKINAASDSKEVTAAAILLLLKNADISPFSDIDDKQFQILKQFIRSRLPIMTEYLA